MGYFEPKPGTKDICGVTAAITTPAHAPGPNLASVITLSTLLPVSTGTQRSIGVHEGLPAICIGGPSLCAVAVAATLAAWAFQVDRMRVPLAQSLDRIVLLIVLCCYSLP